ncbi:carbohydrate ABC transporter permease [Halomarina oriensis]|uniref:ABC transporter permease subunit n=1 Tax=Halomarina oriensis TaxID=671145 RepID=A0A6B0GMW9_9EURY|nr:carbohydrate ABC transporter permease [Halomarina oriensis]MWG36266.1 ABC transporter permease subunit [Halomarina oriensis]
MATESDSKTSDGPLNRWASRSIRNPERTYRAMFYVAAIFFIVTTMFPFYWLIVLALTPNNEILNGIGLVPEGFNVYAFVEVFQQVPFHFYMLNSFILATVTTVIVLFIASFAGYVFGRLEFPGRGVLMLLILAISYFPPAAFVVPLFDIFTGNSPIVVPFTEIALFTPPRLINTPAAMVLPFSALFLPLSIFVLTTFYGQIPDGLEDAARVEGTTRIGALFRVIIPLSAPGVATAGVLTFISVYNEYFFSQIMALGNDYTQWSPLVGGILSYQTQYTTSFNLFAAASIIGVLPVAILVIVAQERIVSGLTAGALKE